MGGQPKGAERQAQRAARNGESQNSGRADHFPPEHSTPLQSRHPKGATRATEGERAGRAPAGKWRQPREAGLPRRGPGGSPGGVPQGRGSPARQVA